MELKDFDYYFTLSKKWDKTGLLEGLVNEDRLKMAYNLEKTAKFLINKTENNPHLSEEIAGIMLPCVRRFPEKIDEYGIVEFCQKVYALRQKYYDDYTKISNALNTKFPFDFDNWWIEQNISKL